MKIAILSFYSGHLERGVENWTKEVATRLSENHEVTVYQDGPKKDEEYKIVSTEIGVDWEAEDSYGKLLRFLFLDYWSRKVLLFTIKILPDIFRNNYDVVVPTSGGWMPALIRLATFLRGGKMVVVGHAGKGWDEINNLYSFPDVFVGLSNFAKRWAKRVNPVVKTKYIPNGIDLEKFSPKGKKAKLDLEKPIILAVGALEKGKRLDLTVEAASRLNKGSLLILGGGWEEEKIKKLGHKKLGKRFLMKKVPHEEIANYYRASDLLAVSTSSFYSFEMVILEAMATNLPVVATKDEVRREIVGEAGVLVDPKNTDEYKKAFKEALKKKWGRKPRKQAEKFGWDKIVGKYEKLFEDLVK